MGMRGATWVASVLWVLLWGGGVAAAQGSGGVARSGMDQGEARIRTRSDVRLGIESGPGTSGQRLQEMARAVSSKLGDIRECYGRVTAEDPTIVGEYQLTVSLPHRGRVQIEKTADTVDNDDLERCVERAIQRADYAGVGRPANVRVQLGFGNTAAAGAEEAARRRAEGSRVEVIRDDQGNLTASGGIPSGEVRFTVTAPGSTDPQTVAAMHRSVRSNIAGLLDCRRRAGRRNMDPSGEIELQIAVSARGRARTRTVRSTVEDSRAPTCVSRSLSRARFERAAAGRARLRLRFGPRQQLDVPVREE